MQPGDIVRISYTGYHVTAKVLDEPNRFGWVEVEQISDFEEEDEGPRYSAHEEFIAEEGEELKPSPLEMIARGLRGQR